MSRRRLHKMRGFTMIELIVVTIVLSLLAAITMPRLISIDRENSFRKSYSRLMLAADQARDLAIQTGTTQVLSFEPSNNSLEIGPDNDQADNPINVSQTLGQNQDDDANATQTFALGSNWTLDTVQNLTTQESESSLRCRFFADGTAEPRDAKFSGDGVELHLRVNRNGQSEVRRGPAPNDDNQQEWEAGDLEIRNAG